jgi:16S rRNA (cytosine967-C5)-methyltransferase
MEITRAQIGSAANALAAQLTFERPADVTLRTWFRANPNLGSRDRAFVADASFAVLRHLRRLESAIGSREPRPLILAALVLVLGRSARSLEPLLKPGEGDWLNGLSRKGAATDSPAIRLSLPDWLHDRLVAAHGPELTERIAQSMLNTAPLDLRVNTFVTRRDDVLAKLRESGIEAVATTLSPWGVRLRDKASLERHALVTSGFVEVQDEGSQLVALLMEAKRGQMVVDFCAGAGGKTLALGAAMRSEGRLYAFDTSEKRLANFDPRLKRSGLSNVHPERIAHENDARVKRLAGKIDSVLIDAPCSGTGTLRRNPDLKWRGSAAGLDELTAKQGAILESASRLVKPGGRVVYATCSLLPEENEGVVERFLASHPGWTVRNAPEILGRQGVTGVGDGPFLSLLPHLHGTDGFFAAVLEKNAE